MNYDDYVNHISQKHRIAIAISVIKSKPNDVSMDEYLANLQRKIKDMESDPNETVCSDDFNFDDEMDQNQREMPPIIDNGNEMDTESNKTTNTFINEDFGDNSQCSQTILNNFVFGGHATNDVNTYSTNLENNVEDVNNVLNGTEDTQAISRIITNNENLSQLTFCESQHNTNNHNVPLNCNDIVNKNMTENNVKYFTNLDSQETEIYSLDMYTQNYTHVSQTQNEPFIVSNKFIRGKTDTLPIETVQGLTKNNNKTNNNENTKDTDVTRDDEMITTNVKRTVVSNELAIHKDNNKEQNYTQMEEQYDDNQIRPLEYQMIYKDTAVFDNNLIISTAPEKLINIIDYTTIANAREANKIYMITEQGSVNNFKHNEENAELDENFEESEMEVDKTDSEDDSQTIRVPFKVLEELQRVKAYLNKDRRHTDGYSTDSGYRSDSQIRGSLKNSSQSSVWINQSAHCLFNYIMETPVGCGNISSEISQALGQLVDKLHEEENYPPFLETLLEAVDSLIRETHEGDNWAEDNLITKDETTHRLVLLNKSKHVLKHSIENIVNILEKIHTNMTQDHQYELTNTSEIENVCHIFHILEIFVKKYIKNKESSVASSQNSQEFPRRSSLTELWKKKWNPNYKENLVSQENVSVCVLKKCSEILNKIIVDCMGGYSLVSFAALQCFNLIQS